MYGVLSSAITNARGGGRLVCYKEFGYIHVLLGSDEMQCSL